MILGGFRVNLHESSGAVASQQGHVAMAIEAGGEQRFSALFFISLAVEDFPQTKTAYESVGVNEAAASTVVGARVRVRGEAEG